MRFHQRIRTFASLRSLSYAILSCCIGLSSATMAMAEDRVAELPESLADETGKQSLFVDGRRVATTKTKVRAGGLLGGTGPGVGIGGRQNTSHQCYRGSIAEVRITAAALTPSNFLLPASE